MEKRKKTNRLEGNRKHILYWVIGIIAIFMVSSSSVGALEFDNVKTYDSQTKTATIKNAYGLGETIAEVKLKTPLNVEVPRGYQKVAEFEVKSYSNYSNALKELELYDKTKGMNKFVRNYDYKVLSYETINVNDYGYNCSDIWIEQNNSYSKQCFEIITGTRQEQREKWTKLTPADFKKNDILTIGIFTDVEKGDRVEWIPNMFGVKIDEWASWTESLNVGLVSYWSLNETVGTIIDSTGMNNGTVFSAISITGNKSYAYNFTRASSHYINFSNSSSLDITGDLSISFLFKANGDYTTNFMTIIGNNDGATSNPTAYTVAFGDLDKEFKFQHNALNIAWSSVQLADNNWHHVVVVRNGSTGAWQINWYFDGVLDQSNVTSTNPISKGGASVMLGRLGDYDAHYLTGALDEVGVWNRSLSASEVTTIWDSGKILTYGQIDSALITQSYPADNFVTVNQSLQFSCNLTGTPTNNITKAIFTLHTSGGVLIQQSNITGLNNISANLSWTLNNEIPDNNYLWACHQVGVTSNQSTSNRTLIIGGTFSICNATNTVKYLNLSFKDETTNSKIDGRINSGTFIYYFSNISNNKTYSFVNNSNNSEYNFCFSATLDNINVRSQLTYNLPTYTSRNSNINYYLSNVTNHTILYLLSDTNGNYFTFRVVDSADSPLSNVYVEGSRYVGSNFITIVNGYTNDAGIINFWLEPDITHTFTFNKTSYPFTTYSLQPLCSASVDCPYTVTLGDTTTATINSTARGISLSITPTAETLNNGTNYNFTMTINSSYWSLTNYGFLLRTNVTNYLGNTTGSLGTGGVLSLYNNTFNLNYTHIYLDWYYTTSQGTTTGTITYYIINSDGYPFSIKHFFDDLKSFMKPSSGSGLFGASGISLDLLIFFIIVIIMGLLGYSTGLTDTASYSVILFILVFLTDSILGLFSIQQYMLTVMVGVISLILIYREVR